VKSRSCYLDENGFTTVSGLRGNPGSVMLRWRASDRIQNDKPLPSVYRRDRRQSGRRMSFRRKPAIVHSRMA
jgi:hypothetical protein